MAKLLIDGLNKPDDLMKDLSDAGFDFKRPISEYENKTTNQLFYAQDTTPAPGFSLVGRRVFCGHKGGPR